MIVVAMSCKMNTTTKPMIASGFSQIHILSYTAQRYIVTKKVTGLNMRMASMAGMPMEYTSKMTPDSQNNGVESVCRRFLKSLLMAERQLVISENKSKNTNMSTMATGI